MDVVSDSLKNLISSQNSLKSLSLMQPFSKRKLDWPEILFPLRKHSNTITKLTLINYKPFVFIANFINLKELVMSFRSEFDMKSLNKLQRNTFLHLQILRFNFKLSKS
jgi:hypothetical protein